MQRRKGNKNTLLDADGAPLPEDALGGLLGGVDRDLFATVFALDSDRLRAGAEALLQGKGEIGQALFSASLAGTPVHRIREALEAEAAALFDGRKSKGVSIRPLLAEYKQGLEASRDALVRPEDWEQTLSAVAAAETARSGWSRRCASTTRGATGCSAAPTRCRSSAPLTEQDGAPSCRRCRTAVPASSTRPSRPRRIGIGPATAGPIWRGVSPGCASASSTTASTQRLLDQAGEIESLHAALAVQRERRNARAALAAEQARLAAELAAGRRALGVDDDPAAVESLRADAGAALSLRATATVLDGATAETRTQRRKLAEHRHALEQVGWPVSTPSPSPTRTRCATPWRAPRSRRRRPRVCRSWRPA